MRRLLAAGLALGLVTAASTADATPLAGQSIQSLTIAGQAYKVTFFDAPFVSTPAYPIPTFGTAATALTAINTIMSSSAFTALLATNNSYFVGVVVPYSVVFRDPSNNQVFSGQVQTGPNSVTNATQIFATTDYTSSGYTIAAFAAIPEPASIALMSLGLFGLGWARRRVR